MDRQNLQTRSLASGETFSIPVYSFQGKENNAPSAYIQSSVHGGEVQGIGVILKLIEYFSKHPPKGDITLVPMCNPYGLNTKSGEYTQGRFDPSTGDNWNRNYLNLSFLADDFFKKNKNSSIQNAVKLFKEELKTHLKKELNRDHSYPKKLAMQLQRLAVNADVVLDLHCDTISVPHVYCPSFAMHSVSAFQIPFVIEIPHVFSGALDEALFCPWVKLAEHYQSDCPIESFTIELGNHERIDIKKAEEQASGILNYLASKKIIEREVFEKQRITSCKLEDFVTVYAPMGGLVTEFPQLGERVSERTKLMELYSLETLKSRIIHAETACIPITHTPSSVVHEGMALMKVMT